jgi:hypothetical protein
VGLRKASGASSLPTKVKAKGRAATSPLHASRQKRDTLSGIPFYM